MERSVRRDKPPKTAHLRRLLEAAKQGENEARRAVGLLNSIINLLPVGVTVQSEDGAIVLEKAMAAELSGAADSVAWRCSGRRAWRQERKADRANELQPGRRDHDGGACGCSIRRSANARY